MNTICVYHDAPKCFTYLNPDITIESRELDECYDLAKKNGSDYIIALFEENKIYDELDSILEIQDEELMEKLEF